MLVADSKGVPVRSRARLHFILNFGPVSYGMDERFCGFKSHPVHQKTKEISMSDQTQTPLTAEILADALECFWNAALGAQQNGTTPVGCIVEGVQAVAIRLKEHSK